MTGTSACAPTRRSSRTSSSVGTARTRSSEPTQGPYASGRPTTTCCGMDRTGAAPRRSSSWSGMLAGADAKARLSASVLSEGPWDLFLSVFGESHSTGHQSWHVHDPEHPRHDPGLRERIGDPLAQVYERLDRALAEHLALLGADITLLGPLEPRDRTALRRHPPPTRDSAAAERLLSGPGAALVAGPRARRRVALDAGRLAQRREAAGCAARCDHARARGGRASSVTLRPTMSAAISCSSMSPNNFVVGGVRINLRGREREGRVAPGREFDQLCDRLGEDFLTLVNVDTGAPVVRSVERTDAHYSRDHLDALPDLLLEWNHDHPIETIWSPRFGLIHGPYTHWRTGDHRPGGLLLARGPGIRGRRPRARDRNRGHRAVDRGSARRRADRRRWAAASVALRGSARRPA